MPTQYLQLKSFARYLSQFNFVPQVFHYFGICGSDFVSFQERKVNLYLIKISSSSHFDCTVQFKCVLSRRRLNGITSDGFIILRSRLKSRLTSGRIA